ncbi:DUF397 domain-containing protein [Streptomyces sp. NPDC020330]|uniref:DUF397 domain-containing protein n=1 Tax=unclassified Streptomyces TaxID=2593676 RepID=UPI0037ACDB64
MSGNTRAAAWRKPSSSADQGACVDVASTRDGRIAVRNTDHPEPKQSYSLVPRWTPGSSKKSSQPYPYRAETAR